MKDKSSGFMCEIPNTDLSFVEYLKLGLKNLCGPTFSRLAVLLDLAFQLIGDPFASHFRTARRSSHTSLNKTVTRALEQLHRLPDGLKKQRILHFKTALDRRCPVMIALDDTLAEKRGKTIYAVKKFFDHVEERFVQAQNLVNAVVKQGDAVLGVSYRLVQPNPQEPRISEQARTGVTRGHRTKDPDLTTKQDLAFEILAELVEELVQAGQPRNTIWIETDAWYPSEQFLRAIRRLGVKFMLAIKKNSQVRLPDKARMRRKETQKRGRPIKILTREVRIAQYFEWYRTAHYFTNRDTGEKISYKEAVLNRKRFGRSKIFAFRAAGEGEWRYFLTPVRTTGAQRAWERYCHRWTVETMHFDLKQYFGLQKCKCRREEVVKGHLELVYAVYSMYRAFRAIGAKERQGTFTARRAYDQVVEQLGRPPPLELMTLHSQGLIAALI